MDSTMIIAIMTVGSGLITFLLGWMQGRKKTRVEIEKTEEEIREKRITNLSNSIKIYEQIHAELHIQLEIVSQKCTELSSAIEVLRTENASLKKEIHSLNMRLKSK